MAGEEGVDGEAPAALDLEGEDAEGAGAASDHEFIAVGGQDLAGGPAVGTGQGSRLPDLEQAGSWVAREMIRLDP